jgi:hypothetical protein
MSALLDRRRRRGMSRAMAEPRFRLARRSTLALPLALSATGLLLLACSATAGRDFEPVLDATASGDAAVEAAPEIVDAGSFADVVVPGTSCARDLDVGKLTISQSACFVNQHVENQKTTLTFPCVGGVAEAKFGGHTFKGTVQGDVVALKDVEPFVFNSCQWESTEKIEGNLATGTVKYSYTERPLQSCTDTPCTASGNLAVNAGAVVVIK